MDKREQFTVLILSYVARNGFADLKTFSHLAKGIGVSRSLIYFYYKNYHELIAALCEHFELKLNEFHQEVLNHSYDFKEYVYALLSMHDLIFFALECSKEVERIPALIEPLKLIQTGVDSYSFEQFKLYYQLLEQDQDQIEFLYSCFRSKWWESLGRYDDWNQEKLDQFFTSMDCVMQSFIHT